MNVYSVQISIWIVCFNKYRSEQNIKFSIVSYQIFFGVLFLAEPSYIIILYFVFENKYYNNISAAYNKIN